MIQTIGLALIDFKDRYPLFNETWKEIVSPYPGKSIEWIIENVHNKIIPKRTMGEFAYNMPGGVEQPVKYTPGKSVQTETELEAFLRSLYNIEIYRNQHIKLDEAFSNVNQLPDVSGIRQLKEILLRNIEYLRKNKLKIGRFEIIPDSKEVYKQIKFNDFESFSKEFLKRAIPIIKQGKLPTFVFGWTSYSYLVSGIEQIATQIRRYYNNEEFDEKNLGSCFLETYNLARWFERSHYQLYDSDIIANATRSFALKISKIIKALNNPKSREVWRLYNEEKAKNDELTDSRIADRIFKFKKIFTSSEGIKVCIKDGKKYSRDIQGDSILKNALLAAGADLDALPLSC